MEAASSGSANLGKKNIECEEQTHSAATPSIAMESLAKWTKLNNRSADSAATTAPSTGQPSHTRSSKRRRTIYFPVFHLLPSLLLLLLLLMAGAVQCQEEPQQSSGDIFSSTNKFEYVPNRASEGTRRSHSNPWGENQRERMHTDYLTQYAGKKNGATWSKKN